MSYRLKRVARLRGFICPKTPPHSCGQRSRGIGLTRSRFVPLIAYFLTKAVILAWLAHGAWQNMRTGGDLA